MQRLRDGLQIRDDAAGARHSAGTDGGTAYLSGRVVVGSDQVSWHGAVEVRLRVRAATGRSRIRSSATRKLPSGDQQH
ncbi:hypothetical protein ABZ371_11845 [Streptomyces sp. NPDC005899]|uniref:hypothetical protein n=1 Tax=Streptomyces sp. NPDC005899 TaxID=3155716 RepID=UPI0033FFDEB6